MKTREKLPFVMVFLFLLILAVPSSGADDATAVYKGKCAACHGPDGKADTPMGKKLKVRNLQSEDVQNLSDEELREIISNGKAKMPAFSKKLTSDEIEGLVTYIRSLAEN